MELTNRVCVAKSRVFTTAAKVSRFHHSCKIVSFFRSLNAFMLCGNSFNPLTTIVQKSILPLRDRNRAYMPGFQRIRSNVFLINIKY